MGYYIETPMSSNKADQIKKLYGAEEITEAEARQSLDKGIIVVIENGLFDAAGFAFDEEEFKAFTSPGDTCHKRFLVMDRQKAEELSNYKKHREELS